MHILEIPIPTPNLKDHFSIKGLKFASSGQVMTAPDLSILNSEGGRRFRESYSPIVAQRVSSFASPFQAVLDLRSLGYLSQS